MREFTIDGVRYIKGELISAPWVCYYPDGTRFVIEAWQREVSLLEEILKLRENGHCDVNQ